MKYYKIGFSGGVLVVMQGVGWRWIGVEGVDGLDGTWLGRCGGNDRTMGSPWRRSGGTGVALWHSLVLVAGTRGEGGGQGE